MDLFGNGCETERCVVNSKASPHPSPVWSAHRAYRCWLSPFFGTIAGDQVCYPPPSKTVDDFDVRMTGWGLVCLGCSSSGDGVVSISGDERLHHGRRQSFACCDQKLQSAASLSFSICEQGSYLTECWQCAKCAIRGEDQAYTSVSVGLKRKSNCLRCSMQWYRV